MDNYQIYYLPIAEKDLTEILEYISLDSPATAMTFLDEFDNTIIKLEAFPYLGNIPKDTRLQHLNYRVLVIDNYLVFYIVTDNIVEIRRILHSRRKYDFLI